MDLLAANDEADMQILLTRASSFVKLENQPGTSSRKITTPHRSNSPGRFSHFFKCETHDSIDKNEWTANNGQCDKCILFGKLDSFPLGKLPTKREILCYIITKNQENKSQGNSIPWADYASDLALHWIFCNVYPQTLKTIKKKLQECLDQYQQLKKTQRQKRGRTYHERLDLFVKSCDTLFDIIGDKDQIKAQEKFWNVKMTNDDHEFYSNQCQIPRIGYCTNFVCRKWEIANTRKVEREKQFMSRQEKSAEYKESVKPVSADSISDGEIGDSCESDCEFQPSPSKKTKYEYINTPVNENDEMPEQYRYIRDGPRSVKKEYYVLLQKLMSQLHMSQAQAEGAIVATANDLFGREWKTFENNKPIDKNTLPASSNTKRLEPYIEAMVLSSITDQIMCSNDSTIVYSNDGSALSGVGNFVVQSISIDGKQRALPTMGIFTESRQSLADLQKTTLKILSASTGNKYTEKEILEKIQFIMTDSTAHNIGVIQKVCEDLEIDSNLAPKSLVCNIHPLMMFQRQVKKVFSIIHDAFGNAKIKECFLVEVEFQNESFIVKAITCLSSFINKDFSAKPWNRQSHFESFIHPKKNESLSFKDHRFNRIFECCLSLIYHLDDIKSYLDEFRNIINGVSILNRAFLDMEILKPILCAAALMGVHITKPLMNIIQDKETTHSQLSKVFKDLYTDLISITASNYLQTKKCVGNFTSQETFESCLPKDCILQSVDDCIIQYKDYIEQLISLFLKNFAEGFSNQKGAIFGFGPNADEDTGNLLKIASVSCEEMKKLDKVPVHNLGEERSVGYVNYELNIRGRQNLESVSKKMILKKSSDLLNRIDKTKLHMFKKPAEEIKDIRLQWNDKMKQYQEKGYSEKEAQNLKEEQKKLKDLDFLKSQNPPGPFSTAEEISSYMEGEESDAVKNHRLYVEVRYARKTCLSLKPTASVFRLKQNYNNLETENYAENLKCYLDSSRSTTNLTIRDLKNVLHALTSSSDSMEKGTTRMVDVAIDVGDHVTAFWSDDFGKYKWHLAIVEKVVSPDLFVLSYLKRVDSAGIDWVFPEEAELRETQMEQILEQKIQVRYFCSTRIRCRMTEDSVKNSNHKLETAISALF